MRATIMHAAGEVRIERVPDPTVIESTNALLRVTRACICGSDLWPYQSMQRSDRGQPKGHEAVTVSILECVGLAQAMETAVGITRADGAELDQSVTGHWRLMNPALQHRIEE